MSAEISSLIPSFIVNNPIYHNPKSRIIFFGIGIIYFGLKLLKSIKAIFTTFLQSDKDLTARYGRNTWALITGASDGIGKAFCFELSRRGFNIILIGRNKEKLEHVENELKKVHPQVQTRIVVKDFTSSYEDYFAEEIYKQVQDLDISILVNNAGQGGGGKYIEMSLKKIRDMILVNCLSHALVTRAILPKLVSRSQKSAIINMSSIVASFPRGHLQIYGSTKVFHDYLSRGLTYEHPNIDIISLRPGFVSTAMIKFREPDMKTITPDEFVQVALRELGTKDWTYGHWKHKWRGFIGDCVPNFLKKYYLKKLR